MTKTMVFGGGEGAKYDAQYNQSLPADRHFNCGFEPQKIIVTFNSDNNTLISCYYDADISTTKYKQYYAYSGNRGLDERDVADTSGINGLAAITSDGFTLTSYLQTTHGANISYIAVG